MLVDDKDTVRSSQMTYKNMEEQRRSKMSALGAESTFTVGCYDTQLAAPNTNTVKVSF